MIQEYHCFDLFGKMLLERVVLTPPFKIRGLMPNEACFLYAVRGSARLRVGAVQDVLETKEAVVMKCGNHLNEWLETDPGAPCEAIAVHFYPEVLRKVYDKEFPEFVRQAGQSPPAPIEKVKADRLLKNYIDSLQFYFENPSLVSDELLKLKVRELILLLAKTDNSAAIQQLISSLFTPTEYSFKEVIEAHIYSHLSNEELAIMTHLSLSSFKREFKKVYQASPASYIRQRKLERAAHLLEHSGQRIGDIAFDCGFEEVSHFSKVFQKHFGISPTDFRLARSGK